MNHALHAHLEPPSSTLDWETIEDGARLRRLRALLALFALYATALLFVVLLSDGADIGCILAGISGHVLYATVKMSLSWRDATWLEAARVRVLRRAYA